MWSYTVNLVVSLFCAINVEMAYINGKIIFGKLKGFPQLPDGAKIQTKCFIDGAKEIVSLIGRSFIKYVFACVRKKLTLKFAFLPEQFGALFMPVVYDVGGNVEVINKEKVIILSNIW